MGSVADRNRGHHKPHTAAEMDNYKRQLVIQLWKRSGAFWEAVAEMRQRWSVYARREVPQKCKVVALRPPGIDRLDTPEKQAIDVEWRVQLSKIAADIVPESLQGGRSPYHRHLSDWEPFISACVLFDPPDTQLESFAELGPFLAVEASSATGLISLTSPPIAKMTDPADTRVVDAEAWSAAIDAIYELYLEPMGLELDEVWEQVHLRHPEILRERQEKLRSLPVRSYIEVNEHTTWDDAKEAFKVLSENRERQPKRGRSKRDRLRCLECAILHDQHGWSYEQLAERYGWLDHTLVSKYIRDGRKIVREK